MKSSEDCGGPPPDSNTDEHRYKMMNAKALSLDQVSPRIIGCAFAVSNALGVGFLESVYENALTLELREARMIVVQRRGLVVMYRGVEMGHFTADIVVNDSIIVELKAASALNASHQAQCINYLKATGKPLCLLLNFGRPRLEIRRIVQTI